MGGQVTRAAHDPDLVLDANDMALFKPSAPNFTDNEIRRLFERFKKLGGTKKKVVPMSIVINVPELAYNPFAGRIGAVFADVGVELKVPDPVGERKQEEKRIIYKMVDDARDVSPYVCSFINFLRMMYVFSSRATFLDKSQVAFKVYDYTGDDVIDTTDIQCIIIAAMGATALSVKDLQRIANEIMNEADLDGNKKLEEIEFSKIVRRIPEFMLRFNFQVLFDVDA